MCGIVGMLDPNHRSADQLTAMVIRMGDTLIHRGPDGTGHWSEPSGTVAFCYRRLAVVDLTSSGCQPMISPDERWVVVFNGEIYNFQNLRKQLSNDGATFRGRSDTEVLLMAVQYWGLDRTLEAIEGMFAIALWDRFRRELHLVRDRFGEKPLYYGWIDGRLAFTSELKAIAALPGFSPNLDRDAISLYLRRDCIPAPFTVYQGFFKLLPGSFITVPADTRPGSTLIPRPYWSALAEVEMAKRQPLIGSTRQLTDELEETLSRAVSSRMVADVPVGAFLSGGVDSSLIVALMQKLSNQPIHTFTVGYSDRAFDESTEAASIASHLGTDHSTLQVSDEDVTQVLPQLPEIWDEPFADPSQIPTLLLSRFTRSNVTVSLSGDGGDELFAGYNRHVSLEKIWSRINAVPPSLRRSIEKSLNIIPHNLINGVDAFAQILPTRMKIRNPSNKIAKLGKILSSTTLEQAYFSLISQWDSADAMVIGSRDLYATNSVPRQQQSFSSFTEEMLWLDLVTYLPDDILTKLDRASMAVSLETRVPFLDRDVFRFAWRLPMEMKVRENKSKWILREVLYRHVPPKLIERPKTGFGLPLGELLRGGLRPWAEELLNEKRLRNQGIVEPTPVLRAWQLHLSGRKDLEYELWSILMLQSWIDHWSPSLNT
jgi:asparagine synthase (glutamine-hydrolysing)